MSAHTGQHLQGCVSCYAYIERRAEFDALLVGPPTTGGLIRHRRRRPTLAARLWARLARLAP